MGIFVLFRKKPNKVTAIESTPTEVERITIAKPKPTAPQSYLSKRAYFGKLHKNSMCDVCKLNILHVEKPIGVYWVH